MFCSLYYLFHSLCSPTALGLIFPTFNRLFTLQNEVAKVVGRGSYNDRVIPFYVKPKVLKPDFA